MLHKQYKLIAYLEIIERTYWNNFYIESYWLIGQQVVGLEIGYLVNWLISDYGLNATDVHLIGHSLGSHISGYAGEQIEGVFYFFLL